MPRGFDRENAEVNVRSVRTEDLFQAQDEILQEETVDSVIQLPVISPRLSATVITTDRLFVEGRASLFRRPFPQDLIVLINNTEFERVRIDQPEFALTLEGLPPSASTLQLSDASGALRSDSISIANLGDVTTDPPPSALFDPQTVLSKSEASNFGESDSDVPTVDELKSVLIEESLERGRPLIDLLNNAFPGGQVPGIEIIVDPALSAESTEAGSTTFDSERRRFIVRVGVQRRPDGSPNKSDMAATLAHELRHVEEDLLRIESLKETMRELAGDLSSDPAFRNFARLESPVSRLIKDAFILNIGNVLLRNERLRSLVGAAEADGRITDEEVSDIVNSELVDTDLVALGDVVGGERAAREIRPWRVGKQVIDELGDSDDIAIREAARESELHGISVEEVEQRARALEKSVFRVTFGATGETRERLENLLKVFAGFKEAVRIDSRDHEIEGFIEIGVQPILERLRAFEVEGVALFPWFTGFELVDEAARQLEQERRVRGPQGEEEREE